MLWTTIGGGVSEDGHTKTEVEGSHNTWGPALVVERHPLAHTRQVTRSDIRDTGHIPQSSMRRCGPRGTLLPLCRSTTRAPPESAAQAPRRTSSHRARGGSGTPGVDRHALPARCRCRRLEHCAAPATFGPGRGIPKAQRELELNRVQPHSLNFKGAATSPGSSSADGGAGGGAVLPTDGRGYPAPHTALEMQVRTRPAHTTPHTCLMRSTGRWQVRCSITSTPQTACTVDPIFSHSDSS